MQGTQEIQVCEVKRQGTAGEHSPLLDTIETTVRKDPLQSLAERKREAGKVAKQLERLGFENKGRKIGQCSQGIYRRSFSCGHESQTRHGERGIFYRCKDKFCPVCNHARSLKLAGKFGRALETYVSVHGLYASHVVLTYKNMDALPDLSKLKRDLKNMFRPDGAKSRREFWKRYGYHGMLVNFEVTVSKDGRFHPHFHILLITERPIELIETGEFAGNWQNWVNQELSDMWLKITKDSYIVQGKSFEFSQMFEMVKYLTKGVNMIPDTQLSELVEWSDGKRFLSLHGKLHKNEELKHLFEEQESEEQECCPECGCNEFTDIPMRFDVRTGRYVDSEDWYDRPLIFPLSPS